MQHVHAETKVDLFVSHLLYFCDRCKAKKETVRGVVDMERSLLTPGLEIPYTLMYIMATIYF